jgi:hypothetical protein
MNKRTISTATLIVVVGVGAWYWGKAQAVSKENHDTSPSGQSSEATEPAPAPESAPAPGDRQPSPPSKQNMRQLIAQVVDEEVSSLRGSHKVGAYLKTLKQRALSQGKVTALEVEPGIEAIRTMESEIGPEETEKRVKAFANEMAALSKQLGGIPDPPAPPTGREVNNLLDEIAGEEDNEFKQQAIKEYVERVNAVEDEEQQAELMNRLDRTIAPSGNFEAPPEMDVIAEEIVSASDPSTKQAAIRKYIDSIQLLEPEEQTRAMRRLEELTGAK